MRLGFLAATAVFTTLLVAQPAYAQEAEMESAQSASAEETESKDCSVTAYATAKTAYVYNDIALYGRDAPTLQSGVTLSCESGWWVDVWNNTSLDLKTGGPDQETDFTVGYSRRMGPFQVDAQASYYAIQPYEKSDDDLVAVTASVGVPIEVGPATVTPYVMPFAWIGVSNDFPDHTFVRVGASFTVPVDDTLTLSGDASRVFNLTDPAVSISPDRYVDRAEISLARDLGDGWILTASAEVSGDLPVAWGLGFIKTF